MKTKILILCFLVFNTSGTQAQFLKKLKEKVSETVEETVNQKVEKKAKDKTESIMDSLFGGNSRKGNKGSKSLGEAESYTDLDQEGMPAFMENLNISDMINMSENISQQAKMASSYTFDTQLTVTITGPGQEAKMDFYFGDNILMNTVEMAPGVKSIWDYNNNSIISLIEEEKTAMALPLDFMEGVMGDLANEEEEEEDTPVSFKKTRKHKNILGFRADEYIAEDDNLKINFWFSDEVPIDNSRMLKGMDKMGGMFAFDFAAMENKKYRDGLMLEFTATDKVNQITTQMKVTQLLTRQNIVVNTSNYNQVAAPN